MGIHTVNISAKIVLDDLLALILNSHRVAIPVAEPGFIADTFRGVFDAENGSSRLCISGGEVMRYAVVIVRKSLVVDRAVQVLLIGIEGCKHCHKK